MSEILDEVSEELRRKRLEEFWKENGSWIIAGVILSILCTAGLSFWRSQQYKHNVGQTAALYTIMNGAGAEMPQALDHYAGLANKNHAVIAHFIAATTYSQRHEEGKAVAEYRKIEDMSGIDRPLRDLATLFRLQRQLDTGDAQLLRRQLEPLTRKNAVWRYSALELLALLDARENKPQAAAKVLSEITAAADAPDELRRRAETMRAVYLGMEGGGASANDANALKIKSFDDAATAEVKAPEKDDAKASAKDGKKK
ncbi:MAG: tetratricopeptide repeat protein [Alphaproteobacteria bacterium]|nr:tetratricopeptide repeat protein [Alphaproteobacteria bacterium]